MKALCKQTIHEYFPIDKCQSMSLFGALSANCVRFLLENGEAKVCAQGEYCFAQGEASPHFYIILSGQLGYYRERDGRHIHLRSYKPGAQLGFSSMIGLHERRGHAIAEQDSIVLQISTMLFHDMFQYHAEDFAIFLINMTREMSREIIDMDARCVDLAQRVVC